MTLNDQLNECKIKLINEKENLVELEKKLEACEKHTDNIRHPIIASIIISFILNTLGYAIMSPAVVLGSLLMLLGLTPAYIIFMVRDGRSGKVEEQIKVCKENIEKYENDLELLNSRYETQTLINERTNVAPIKLEAMPIRINEHDKKNNKIR